MTKWTPKEAVRKYIKDSDFSVRDKPVASLYDQVTFYITEHFWKLGIAISKRAIFFTPMITVFSDRRQAGKIVHELTHVAQYMDYGWVGFIATYAWEWVRSGFNYDKMKNIGMEKEATAAELKFRILIA